MSTRKFTNSRHAFILMLCSYFICACGGSYLPPQLYESQVNAFEKQDETLPPPQGAAVVFGSSSIQLWENIQSDLAPVPIIARGFAGNTMNDARYYAERMIIAYKPDLIVLYEGDNDISAGIPPARVLEVFQQLEQTIRLSLPKVPIYFISIKPSPSRMSTWPLRVEANNLIKQHCQQDRRLRYIDVASAMLDKNGNVRTELFQEGGLHLNWQGYRLWREIIQPVLHDAYLK